MNQVLAKEINDFTSNKAQIMNVLKAIAAREKCIQMIREADGAQMKLKKEAQGEFTASQEFVNEMS